jgi:uncharacterized protein with HEPN domain
MTEQGPLWRLGHILHEIDIVLENTSHLSDDEMGAQYVTVRMVERCVSIISEATKHVPQGLRESEPDISWRKIVNIGNLLRHEYYRINGDDMIRIVRDHLPQLRSAIVRLIDRLSAES